jgi:hypothetical protein
MSNSLILADLIRVGAVAAIVVLAIVVGRIGYVIWTGDANEYERNRHRVKSLKNSVSGTVPTKYDGTRDDKVAAGIAIKDGKWIEQGRLSDEALHDVLAG